MPDGFDDDGNHGARQQPDEDRTSHLPHHQDAGEQKGEHENQRRDRGDRAGAVGAEPDGRRRQAGRADEARVDQPDEQDEGADPRSDRELDCIGTASKINVRRPVAASTTMMMPLITTRPIASGQVTEPTTVVARNELMPSPAAKANGSRAISPNRTVMTPAASDVAADTCAKSRLFPATSRASDKMIGFSTTM
jgi:hypothetical protein